MASTISISVGALPASRTFQNDQKVRDTLLAYHTNLRLGGTTNAEKLAAILDYWIADARQKARQGHMEQARDNAATEADTLYGFE